MTHLLAISVGPVQEFITAARRTRDLWFGSRLLSKVSLKVAKEVENQGGTLIFPASLDAVYVANVSLAELRAGDPKEVRREGQEGRPGSLAGVRRGSPARRRRSSPTRSR